MASKELSNLPIKYYVLPYKVLPSFPKILNIYHLKGCWSMKHEQSMNYVWSLFKISYKETRTIFLLITLNWFHTGQGFP